MQCKNIIKDHEHVAKIDCFNNILTSVHIQINLMFGLLLKKVRSSTCYSAPLWARPTAEALRYMARTKQRRTYLPYTFPAAAGTHLPTPKGWRVE